MRKEKIYSLSSLYRENMDIYGYRFGKGEKMQPYCRGYAWQ